MNERFCERGMPEPDEAVPGPHSGIAYSWFWLGIERFFME
jgi:hypothetical protein